MRKINYLATPEFMFEPPVLPSSGQSLTRPFGRHGSQDAVCTAEPQISKAARSPWARVLVFSAEEGEGPGRQEGAWESYFRTGIEPLWLQTTCEYLKCVVQIVTNLILLLSKSCYMKSMSIQSPKQEFGGNLRFPLCLLEAISYQSSPS